MAMANRKFVQGRDPRILKILSDLWRLEVNERIEGDHLLK